MSELNQVVENTPSEPAYESPSIGDMLQSAPSEGETETAQPTPEEAFDAAQVEAPATAEALPVTPTVPTPEVAPQAPVITPEIQAMIDQRLAEKTKGLIGAVQSERARRQELEQQLGGAIPSEQAESVTQALRSQMLTMSENSAKRYYKDYDAVSQIFYTEAATNEALRDSVLNSPDPGEAAYRAGLNLKLARDLGPEALSNPYSLIERGEKQGYEKARAELTKEFEAKLAARSGEKQKTPTDISQARSTGSVSVPYRSPSLTELLKRATK